MECALIFVHGRLECHKAQSVAAFWHIEMGDPLLSTVLVIKYILCNKDLVSYNLHYVRVDSSFYILQRFRRCVAVFSRKTTAPWDRLDPKKLQKGNFRLLAIKVEQNWVIS